MNAGAPLLVAQPLTTLRLNLVPLQSADADEMFPVLHDQRLHQYTGGQPRTLGQLRAHYERLALGISPDGREAWLNWIVRLQDGTAIGYLQCGVEGDEATAAWVIGVRWQRQGYASEAAATVFDWLALNGVTSVSANIQPGHVASESVAARLRMELTQELIDGERVWRRLM